MHTVEEIQGFCFKIQTLKNIFRALQNGNSIRQQSTPPQVPADKRWDLSNLETPNVYYNCWCTKIANFESPQNVLSWKPSVLIPVWEPKNHPNVYQNCCCTQIASFWKSPELAILKPINFGSPLCVVDKPGCLQFLRFRALLCSFCALLRSYVCAHVRSLLSVLCVFFCFLGLFEDTRKFSKTPRIFLTVQTLKNPVKQAENTQKQKGQS